MRSWLKEIRMSQGIKQEEIAVSAEISRGYYANIERGEKTPSVEVAKKIAAFLKFEWSNFFLDKN
ncbi:helix-turn-helix transcriptional regulator [Lysinibacillus sp. FSL K6-0075]|uniref:helix-turn-helix transcriptional regulator n=1 Tax=Lysinibacillus sp. FSL K6-0075 TaxID=2921415 RepID=UPI00315863EA